MIHTCFYCLNCTKFGQLIVIKITKIVATKYQTLKAKMHEIRFRPPPQIPRGLTCTALPQTTYLHFRAPTSKGGERGGNGEGIRAQGGRKDREAKGKEGKDIGAVQFLASGRRRCSYATVSLECVLVSCRDLSDLSE